MTATTTGTGRRAWIAAIGVVICCAGAAAQPTAWKHPDGTTHWYEAVHVPGGVTWALAQAEATASGGYLATITSALENDFVFGLVDNPELWGPGSKSHTWAGPWIGGVQAPRSAEPDGGWIWTELEPFTFAEWDANQPDDQGGADRIHFGGVAEEPAPTWHDAPGSTRLRGYVVEYSGPMTRRTVGLQKRDRGSFDGYTLFAPNNTTSTYLIDPRGRIVNHWESEARPGVAAYLLPNGHIMRSARTANPIFEAGGVGGKIEEYDWNGNLVWEFTLSNDRFCLHHDFAVLPSGNILMIAWELKTGNEAEQAGRNPTLLPEGTLWPDMIIEVQPTGSSGGKIVWEWHSWDHLVQDHDPSRANYGVVSEHPELIDMNFVLGAGPADWHHLNAIAYNPELDQIVLSSRSFSEIWVIDHGTTTAEAASHAGGRRGKGGDLLYRWGNPATYRSGTALDRRLFHQHDAHWIAPGLPGAGNLLIFNNGEGRARGDFSTVDEIVPPLDTRGTYLLEGAAYGPKQPAWFYEAPKPTDFYSRFISGAQRLPNGNTLICSGLNGRFFEVSPGGAIVWQYDNPAIATGLLRQGDVATFNASFRSPRYSPTYPAFAGKTLTPGAPLEGYSAMLLADGSAIDHRAAVGSAVELSLIAEAHAGRPYQAGSSLVAGTRAIDHRVLRLSVDWILIASVLNFAPDVFQGYAGVLDAKGHGAATLNLPSAGALVGLDVHSAFVVIDPLARSGIGLISNTVLVQIER